MEKGCQIWYLKGQRFKKMKHIFEWNKLKKLISFRFAFILLFLLGTYLFLISKPYNLNMASVIRDITVLSEIKVPAGSLQQGILDNRQQTTDNRQQTTDVILQIIEL